MTWIRSNRCSSPNKEIRWFDTLLQFSARVIKNRYFQVYTEFMRCSSLFRKCKYHCINWLLLIFIFENYSPETYFFFSFQWNFNVTLFLCLQHATKTTPFKAFCLFVNPDSFITAASPPPPPLAVSPSIPSYQQIESCFNYGDNESQIQAILTESK